MKINNIILFIIIAIPALAQENFNFEKLNLYLKGIYIYDFQISNDTFFASTDENIIYFCNDTIHNLIDGDFKNSAITVRNNNIFLIKEEEGMFKIFKIKNNKIIRTNRLEYENIFVDFNHIYMAADDNDNLFISMLDFSNNFDRPDLIVFKLDENLNIIKKFTYRNISYNNYLFSYNNYIYLVLKYEDSFSLLKFNNNNFENVLDLDFLSEDNYGYLRLANYYLYENELTLIYEKDKLLRIIVYNLNNKKLDKYFCPYRNFEMNFAFANIDRNIYYGIDTVFYKLNPDNAFLENIKFSYINDFSNLYNKRDSDYYCKIFLAKKINYTSDVFIVLNYKTENCDRNMLFINIK
jgi:hypothetical protein